MNTQKIKTEIQNLLKDEAKVNELFFKKEFGNNFLKIELEFQNRNMDHITTLSKKISVFLDENNLIDVEYILDIYSSGTSFEIKIDELENYIDKKIEIFPEKQFYGLSSFVGKLKEIHDNDILVIWDQKGNMRKIKVEKSNIVKINKYFF
ncbi:MAG: hypothetical protein NC236_02585 [Mycoplasma sp.]|nr:hypothetical protein [Mycoplasma sp.]